MTGDWPLDRLMSDVVGSGPRSASDMRYDQAREAMERILSGDPDPVTLGGFWTANRWKRNTPTELAGFLDAVRTASVETAVPDANPVDIGANYDGKAEAAPMGVASGVVAAAAGTPVVTHSAGRLPTTYGVTYRHVLAELGVPTDLHPSDSAAMVDETGFGFYDASRFNPGVHALSEHRAALGVRTFLNTIETLANPAGADVHLGSFFHRPFAEKVIATLRESRTVDVDRVVLVQGQEGYDDVRAGTTRVAEWTGDREGDRRDDDSAGADGVAVDISEIETASFGVTADATVAGDDLAATAAHATRAVVTGDSDDAVADAVALNAGVRIYARQDAPSLSAAVDSARASMADGSAADVLASLRRFDPATV